ncbi:MAG: nitrogen fixation protein NifEN [Candidatus Dactylopiibacterium carminicum]|nr:MAG: nitrogen fixation protein NifEN [Candidatus Dactylopiibacterium carminicum]
MKASEIAALKDEPACDHNKVAEKAGCARPEPGATAGGCPFDGAQITLLPIADVAHIVHGPIGCSGNSWDNRGTRSSGPKLYRVGMTTDLTEQDVIMGRGEKRLFHAIKQAADEYAPAAVFVYATCVTAVIGDDLEAVCKAAAARWGVPVVPVDCAGFYGNKNIGNRIAGETLVRHVIGTREPGPTPTLPDIQVHDISLIGEYNIAGEFWKVAPLFDELGLRIIGSISGDARFAEVQTMHRAEASMVVCARALVNVARRVEERWGVPWFEGSFYGVADTSQALRDFARLIGDPDLSARTEALIAREEALAEAALAPWRERLRGKRALLYTGGVKSWSIISALQDLGMTVVASGTRKSSEEDKARIRELMGEDALMLDEGGPKTLLGTYHQHGADILIAGGRNLYTALKARVPFLDINQEREFGYAGYAGMVDLAHQLALSIESPVWEAVRRPAPWARRLSCRSWRTSRRSKTRGPSMAEIIRRSKPLSVSPLKASSTLGASLAFLGLYRAMPMLHGAMGCTAFGKIFLTRHFREPIPIQSTGMDHVATVMGADENVIEGLRTLCEKHKPEVIGLPTTGLPETQGTDIQRLVREFRAAWPQYDHISIIPVNTPDYTGSLESGFALAVEAIIETLVPVSSQAGRRRHQVNVLANASLTPGDIEAIREWCEAFGLRAVVLPDIGDSLDGHLIEAEYATLTAGGTPRDEIVSMGESVATLVIGESLRRAADALRQRTGVPDHHFPHLMGLDACDRFTETLAAITGLTVPARIERQRAQLQDAMVDSHFMTGFLRVALAGEADLLTGLSALLTQSGAQLVAAVAPVSAPSLRTLPCAEVLLGDLQDLERVARANGARFLISNAHADASAERLGLPLLRAGFPQYDRLGAAARVWVGYRGSRATLFDIANLVLEHHHDIPAYRSRFWSGGPREHEMSLSRAAQGDAGMVRH